jgi:hypothetical protein
MLPDLRRNVKLSSAVSPPRWRSSVQQLLKTVDLALHKKFDSYQRRKLLSLKLGIGHKSADFDCVYVDGCIEDFHLLPYVIIDQLYRSQSGRLVNFVLVFFTEI